MKSVTAIAHVALRIADIDRSLDFYVGKLGFAEMFRLDRDGRLWIVYLRITDTQYLELFPGGDGERAPGPNEIGPNHFCLEVNDIDAAISELADKGVSLIQAKKKAVDGNNQAWIEDPDGNRIELMQMSGDCLQLRAIARLSAESAKTLQLN
jgi:lactoylglutathione lyase